MGILLFILILAALILIHEFGHFIVAKRAGIRVDEFGIGFPPRLFGVRRGETIYSINAIPFGGFVKIFGEDPSEEVLASPEHERSFIAQSRFTQTAVLGAGVAFNIIGAWLLLSISFAVGVPTVVSDSASPEELANARVVVVGVAPNSPAEHAGFMPGDALVALDTENASLQHKAITIATVQEFIQSAGESALLVTADRNGTQRTFSATPQQGILDGRAALGISMETIATRRLPLHAAVLEGARETYTLAGASAVGLFSFAKNAVSGDADFSQVSGPVGIAGLVGNVIQFGYAQLLGFAALISINLAVINLLPIPALDGGRLFFVLIETVRRKALNPRMVTIANTTGFALLLLLMLAVTYNDIANLL